jgi:putative copper export protein
VSLTRRRAEESGAQETGRLPSRGAGERPSGGAGERPSIGAGERPSGPRPVGWVPTGAGRAVGLLLLVAVGALVPLFGPRVALDGTGEAATPGAGGIALLRTVLLAALCVPVGELFVVRLARRVPGGPRQTPRGWAAGAAAAGCVAALGLASVVATGNLLPDSPADIDVGGLYATRDGRLALLEVNAFAAVVLCARSRRTLTQVVPLTAIVVAEALRAHPTVEDSALVGTALTFVHLLCAVLWVGGLLCVLRTLGTRAWRATPGAGAALLGLYARVAAVLLAAVTATGSWSTLRRMPPGTVLDQLTETAYGRALLAKVLLMAAVAALALRARLRLRHVTDPLDACAPARAELVVLGVVVAVSGLLTALPVPIRW